MNGDLRLVNARIWTGDPSRPWAHTLRIRDGRVAALDGEVGGTEPRLDVGQRTVLPGLIDAHLHLLLGGLSLHELDLSAVDSRAAFELAIADAHASLAADQWLIGRGWSSQRWGGLDPDSSWLAPVGDRPAACWRMDHHAVLVNDAVLARGDWPREIEGGRMARHPMTGRPTGLMIEAAAWRLIQPLIPEPSRAHKRQALLSAQAHVHQRGLTAVGSMEYARDLVGVYLPLRSQLTLRCRATVLDRSVGDEPLDCAFAVSFPNDAGLAVIGCKTFIDGTLGSRTARMLRDYDDDPGNRGLLVELAAAGRLRPWARAVAATGLSPSMHAIGDEAARLALDAVEGIDPICRPRIEHAQQIDPADMRRFAGVIASMQPTHKADDGCYVRQRVGESRLPGTFAFRALLDAGARLAFGSDWPVVSCDPMLGVQAAVTGRTRDGSVLLSEQNLTVEEALRAYTTGAAYALRLDDAGALRPGAMGDAVVLDRDPFAVDWNNELPRVVMTIVGGEVVYDGR